MTSNATTPNNHPMVAASHTQGSTLVGHITTNPSQKGSGMVVGKNGQESQIMGRSPTLNTGGVNNQIVGPGGQNPASKTTPTINTGGTNRQIVGPGGQNPLATAANRVVNSLEGRGSLGSYTVHVGQVSKNISDALNIAREFNNTDLQTHLETAQSQMAIANQLSGTAKSQALANAHTALNNARAELSSMGYNGKSSSNFSMSKPNNRLVF